MPTRVVKLPNDKYILFSTIVDHFTSDPMDRSEMLSFAERRDGWGKEVAQKKVQNADADEMSFPPSPKVPRDGLCRWREALESILIHHDLDEAKETILDILGEGGESKKWITFSENFWDIIQKERDEGKW